MLMIFNQKERQNKVTLKKKRFGVHMCVMNMFFSTFTLLTTWKFYNESFTCGVQMQKSCAKLLSY